MSKAAPPNADRLPPGTPCLIIRSSVCPEHIGKVVVVVGYNRKLSAHRRQPQLVDPRDGWDVYWMRTSLKPLSDKPGLDKMLRITGRPNRTRMKVQKREASHV